jgi:hypothetical protein
VPVRNDTTLESTKNFFVTLSNPGNATLFRARGEGWILDSVAGQALQFSAANYSVSEATHLPSITVKRSGGTAGTATVHYQTSDGTAIAGENYTPSSGVLNFAAGVTLKTFTVPILNDKAHEAGEVLLLSLANPTGAALGPQSTAVLAIHDNDPAGTIQFTAGTYTVKESDGLAKITVKRTGGTASGVTVDYATSDGTGTGGGVAGEDYVATSGTLTFAASGTGATTQSFTVPILDDHSLKGDKTVNLSLSDPTGGARLGTLQTARLIIQSDDPVLQFSQANYSVAETGKKAVITVKRGGPTTGSVSVDFATSDGTASSADGDYVPTSGTVTFGPGVLSKSFSVTVNDSSEIEGNETVNLTLCNPGGGAVLGAQSTAVLTITTDDASVAFTKPGFTVTETAPKATITVKRTGGMTKTVTVAYATSDGTAHAGSDYLATSGTLSFAPGVTSRSFTVPILPDPGHATEATVNLALDNVMGGFLGTPASATLTITGNSEAAGMLQFIASDYSVSETGPVATVTVTRAKGTAGGVTVDYAASDGSGIAGTNYQPASGTLVFEDGDVSQSFVVTVLDDQAKEGNKTVNLCLSNPTGNAQLGTRAAATLWIVDNR